MLVFMAMMVFSLSSWSSPRSQMACEVYGFAPWFEVQDKSRLNHFYHDAYYGGVLVGPARNARKIAGEAKAIKTRFERERNPQGIWVSQETTNGCPNVAVAYKKSWTKLFGRTTIVAKLLRKRESPLEPGVQFCEYGKLIPNRYVGQEVNHFGKCYEL